MTTTNDEIVDADESARAPDEGAEAARDDTPSEEDEAQVGAARPSRRASALGRIRGLAGFARRGRRPWFLAGLVVVVAAAALVAWRLHDSGLPDGTALEVGGTSVTVAQVDDRIDTLEALYGVKQPASGAGKSEFPRDVAKSMAVQIMLEDEAADRDIAVGDKEVSDALQMLIDQRYPDGGRRAFLAALGDMGATEDQVREEIRQQLLVSRLFDDVVSDVSVTDDEVRSAFEERKDELGTPVRRVIRNIVVADRASADRVLRLLRSGQSFAGVASTYSLDGATRDRGGLLGPVGVDDLENAYAKAAFTADPGDLFGPVRTSHGWNVGLVERVVPSQPATFGAVEDALRKTLVAEQSLDAWRAWLKGVLEDHDVTYADAYRPADPDAVPDVDEAQLTGGAGKVGN